ncbi:hypothetical protein ACLIJR_11985 [Hydrogenophaga sp. XSHU_21]
MAATVTFIEQAAPVDEYGRALYAVARSIVRAMIDSLSEEDLSDLNTPLADVNFRQLSKVSRLERDKGMRGDGFEWAVHEAILGREPTVIDPLAAALKKCSKFVKDSAPMSLLFGQERARYLGFMESVVDGREEAFLLTQGSGRPFYFGPWVQVAAQGHLAEPQLEARIKKIWKTDLFLYSEGDNKHLAATVKSNPSHLEGGKGLRIGIVPEANGHPPGVLYNSVHGLWQVTLADPSGFMGIFNDAYLSVARAVNKLGKMSQPPYYAVPSAKGQKLQAQLERFGDAKAAEVEAALDDAAQQDLVNSTHRLVSVNAPSWLHIKEMAPRVISAKPSFARLD